MILSYNQLV